MSAGLSTPGRRPVISTTFKPPRAVATTAAPIMTPATIRRPIRARPADVAATCRRDEHDRCEHHDSGDSESDDGCDAAMVRIDAVHRVLEFAGAKLGLLHLKPDGTVDRISPSRVSLGYQQPPREAPLLQRIAYEPGSMVVMVSDGFTDQIGGDAGAPRAYGYRRLTELLQSSRGESATVIAARMKDSLAAWQGHQLRRDDVTAIVFGLQ